MPEKSPGTYGGGDTRDLAGKAVGVSGFSVGMARRVLDRGVRELVNAVDAGALPVATAARNVFLRRGLAYRPTCPADVWMADGDALLKMHPIERALLTTLPTGSELDRWPGVRFELPG